MSHQAKPLPSDCTPRPTEPPIGVGETVHGQGIGNLVGEDDALDGSFGQVFDPFDAGCQRRFGGECRFLARGQFAAHFENQIAGWQLFSLCQRAQNGERQLSAAGTEFEHRIAARSRERFCDLERNNLTEQGGDFRRGDEVARRAELLRSGAIVTSPGA